MNTTRKPAAPLQRFTRSHISEVLVNCRFEQRDPGLGELLRAVDQYDALLDVNERLVAALREQVDAFGAKAADEVDSPRIAKIRVLLAELEP